MKVEAVGRGCYRVIHDGDDHEDQPSPGATGPDATHGAAPARCERVYVAGPAGRRWAFWNGRVFREEALTPATRRTSGGRHGGPQQLTAPMPATVLKVLASPGQGVRKGDTLVIIEAMKMELPLRAPADATVTAVRCREGELVQPDALLVEFE